MFGEWIHNSHESLLPFRSVESTSVVTQERRRSLINLPKVISDEFVVEDVTQKAADAIEEK